MDIIEKLLKEYRRVLAETGTVPAVFTVSEEEYDDLVKELGVLYNGVPFADTEGRLLFKMIPVEVAQ